MTQASRTLSETEFINLQITALLQAFRYAGPGASTEQIVAHAKAAEARMLSERGAKRPKKSVN